MASSSPESTAAFRAVLCGVDGSDTDAVIIDQAAALAGSGARLDIVCVVEGVVSEKATMMLTPERATRALERAAERASAAGVDPHAELVKTGWGESDALLERTAGHDLLVVGANGRGRADGILMGSTSTAAVHRAPCPVLVARPVAAFPGTVLLADNGTESSADAARIATLLAAQHGCEVRIAAPRALGGEERRRLAENAADLREAMGADPVVVDLDGDADEGLPRIAGRDGISLLVLGSRELTGVRALGSVSERVAHSAACSVLVVRDK